MAPVLLGGYDAATRRGAAEGPNHPYKMPKVEGTPAVLVTSSLEVLFFSKSGGTKNSQQIHRSLKVEHPPHDDRNLLCHGTYHDDFTFLFLKNSLRVF